MRIIFRSLLVTAVVTLSFLLTACEEETGGESPAAEETVDARAIALAELFSMTPQARRDLCELYRLQGTSAIRDLPWNFADAWYEEALDELVDEVRINCP